MLAAKTYCNLLLFAISSITVFGSATASTPGSSTAGDGQIRSMLVTRIDVQHRGTGAVILIVTPDERRTIAYGTIAAGNTQPVNGDTVFDIASITKVFTSLLLSDMVRRNELALDDPAAKYLGEHGGSIPVRDGRAITLADLATHTAGLPLRPSNLISKDPDNKYDGYTTDLLYAFLSGYPLPRDPGSRYEYSNVGYGLLGQVLSHRAGLSYEKLVSRRIAGPLGMRSTELDETPDMKRRGATGYTIDGLAIKDAERGALDASGAIHSTANDLSRLLEVALGIRKSPLAPAMRSMLGTRRPGGMAPWSTQIALAWNVLKIGNREIVWKNGSAGGFRSFIGYDPARRIGVIGLINVQSDLGVDDICMHLLGADIPVDMHVPRKHVQVSIDPALLQKYVGRYRFSDDDIATFASEDNRLFYLLPSGDKLELLAESNHDFFIKEIDAQISFDGEVKGSASAAIWHQNGQEQRGERLP